MSVLIPYATYREPNLLTVAVTLYISVIEVHLPIPSVTGIELSCTPPVNVDTKVLV